MTTNTTAPSSRRRVIGLGTLCAAAASCGGATRSGAAVHAAFAGTADVQKETCRARLTITVAGEKVVDRPDVDCFAVK